MLLNEVRQISKYISPLYTRVVNPINICGAKLFLGADSSTVYCMHKTVLSTSLHITARTMLLWFVLFFLGLSEQSSHLVSRCENQGNIVLGGKKVVLKCFVVDQVSDHKL